MLLYLLLSCTTTPDPVTTPTPVTTLNKAPLDDRDYRLVKLDNGLKILLISDSNTETAAAALSIGVGQFQDPADREGLAHFLEHMLFMGTDRYPGVDDYKNYLSAHGGGSNASTSQETTTYYFTIEYPYLDGALDRFSRFFVAPLLDPQQVDRERNAVDSEYNLKIQEEVRRRREVRRQTSNPEHGFSQFSVGNLDTLADRGENDLVWDDLKTFYAEEYSASRMTLSVLGREDLDTLEQWVRGRFAEVPTNNTPPPDQSVPIYRADQQGVWIYWSPITEQRQLRIELPMPTWQEHFDHHPTAVITSLLGQEGEGSLHAALTERGWITSLMSGTDGARDHGLLTVTTALTEEGYANIDTIVSMHFQYIRLIQQSEDLSPWWDELQRLSTLNFTFSEPPQPRRAVNQAVSNLQQFPEERVLDAWATWSEYDPALQQTFLDGLQPGLARIFVSGPDLETDQVEARYQVPWSMVPIDEAVMERWRQDPIDSALTLPDLNPYIAEDIDTKSVEAQRGAPALIVAENGLSVWHLQDPTFGVPRATISVRLIEPDVVDTRLDRLKNTLLIALLSDSINTDLDRIRTAGMSARISRDQDGLTLRINGYDDKQERVLDLLLESLNTRTIDPQRLEIIRTDMVRRWQNTTQDRPNTQANRALGWVLSPKGDPFADAVDELAAITAEDVQAYADELFRSLSVEVFVHGNHSEEETAALARRIYSQLSTEDTPESILSPVQIRQIPQQADLRLDLTADHNDSALEVYYQGENATINEQAHYLLLSRLMGTPFFSTLRTEKQLGYIVYAGYHRFDHLPGLQMGIQSSQADAQTLLQEVDGFLSDFDAQLMDMNGAVFDDTKQALITGLTEPPNDLYDRTGDLLNDLSLGITSFDRKVQLAAAVETLGHEDIMAFYRERVLGPDTRRLAVRITGHTHADVAFDDPGYTSIAELTETLEIRELRQR